MAWWRMSPLRIPLATQLSVVLADASVHCAVKVHRRGTYICMEGPQFSTLAEAQMHRQLRFEVVGMTNATEAKLAREAEALLRHHRNDHRFRLLAPAA